MRRALWIGILIALGTTLQLHAGDFTGGYAGVNVGSGFERGREAKGPGARSDQNSATSNDLPPSAAVAAKTARQTRPVVLR